MPPELPVFHCGQDRGSLERLFQILDSIAQTLSGLPWCSRRPRGGS
jgi:hypothetical protein